MNITLIVGDVARVAEGKLDVLGAGWTLCGPGPVNLGVGVLVEVPWAELGESHHFELVLLDHKGQVVPGPNGEPLMRIHAELATQKPPGVLLGAPQIVPMALNLNGVPVPPGGRYKLLLTHKESPNVSWEWSFNTRPGQQQQLAG